MTKFWPWFFIFWPILAVAVCVMAPSMNWWFPGQAWTPLGRQIDDLFFLINAIVTAVFIGTQIALGYVLWRGARFRGVKAWFTHGSHNLEVVWTIVPAGILLFIALYQLDVWAQYRVKSSAAFPSFAEATVAEVTARQFEWRIRYPAPDRNFADEAEVRDWIRNPKPDDLYTVNDLHVPTGRKVMFHLRTDDVQHAFFAPELRVKQDAVPGLVIPVWFEVIKGDKYELVCAELCGWGHYKMQAQVWAQPESEFRAYLEQLGEEQSFDGFTEATDEE